MTTSDMEIIASTPVRRKAGGVLLAVVLAMAVPFPAPAGDPDPAAPEAELEQLKARIESIDRDIAADRGQRDSLKAELEAAEKAISNAASATRAAANDLDSQKKKVEAARREREAASGRLEEARTRLGHALRALYMADAPTRIQAVFQADRLAAIDRAEADASAVAVALASAVADVRSRIEALAATEATLQAQIDDLATRRETREKTLANLRDAQAARKAAMDAIARRITDRTAERTDAEKEQARLQKVIESVRRALREAPDMKYEQGVPFSKQRGHLPWPLRGDLLAQFGEGKAGGGRLKWNGWWIAADEGAPVRAVADARVVYVGQIQRYGLVVILDHAGDYLSLYGHIQSTSSKVGDVVKAGDTIAAAGSSGGHEQTGLYFEIRQGTTPVDPKPWLVP